MGQRHCIHRVVSTQLFGCHLAQVLIVRNFAVASSIIAVDQCTEVLIRNVDAVVGQICAQLKQNRLTLLRSGFWGRTYIILIDIVVFVEVDEVERAMNRESLLLLGEQAQLLGLNLILQVRCPRV